MPDDIYVKHYFGESADRPEVDNGKILFETDTHALYADHNNQRIRYNPPADWNETNESSPSFIANKPDLLAYWNILKEPDPWEEIINNVNYATDYQIGKLVDLDFGEYGIHPMELVAMDADDKADGFGKAKMTWISKDIITIRNMNEQWDKSGGWENSDLRSWLIEEVINDIPQLVANNIIQVNKTYLDGNDTKTCTDNIWIPSCNEVFHTDSYYGNKYENSGCKYDEAFPFVEHPETQSVDYSSQARLYNGNECIWWTRTKKSHLYTCISSHGGGEDKYAYDELGIVIGFCL